MKRKAVERTGAGLRCECCSSGSWDQPVWIAASVKVAAAKSAFFRKVGEANPELAERLSLALEEITAVATDGPAA